MLAQNFKSHVDLGITEPQFDALRKTLVLLETGKLKHQPMPDRYAWRAEKFSGLFNMGGWRREAHCGTIACIGGTAEIIGDVTFNMNKPYSLNNLFYPNMNNEGVLFDYHAITPAQAARALRSYLTTGDAKWSEAVA